MTNSETGRAPQLPPSAPPLPDEVREAARLAPDHWIGVVDPGWREDGPPPRWAVAGEWRSGESGEVEEWEPNEEYRPSPSALGWSAPTDPVDEAVRLAVTGYGPVSDVLSALADAEVSFVRAPDGGPLAMTSPDGGPTVPVFTSPAHQPFSASLAHDSLPARELAAYGMTLTVNPAGPACMVVGAAEVLAAAESGEPVSEGDAAPADVPATARLFDPDDDLGAPTAPGVPLVSTASDSLAVPGSPGTAAAGGTV
ncbi:type VII secretion system-associated protein [Streptomyces sp. S3(2020)]|uniref:type VII secretion system-associated protein n=1 Tax=Streptomyces sp. S3(2020) TaxID=2732044 RepID=UPI003217BB0F